MKQEITISPSPVLAPFIKSYNFRTISLPSEVHFPSFKNHVLNIFLEGKYSLVSNNNDGIITPGNSIIVGQQARHNWDIRLSGNMNMIAIQFQPYGIHALLGLNMNQLLNNIIFTRDVAGPAFDELELKLRESRTITQKSSLLDEYFIPLLSKRKAMNFKFFNSITWLKENYSDRHSIPEIAKQTGYSLRQYERKFKESIGTSPITFLRKERFMKVLDNSLERIGINWTDIAYTTGYFDQAHLIRDFKTFTSKSPRQYFTNTASFSEVTY